MNRSLSKWIDCTVRATDGDVGAVRQFYFDDLTWTIRYIVVHTGGWLSGRQVLLSPATLGKPDWRQRVLPVNLTREQVRHSPDIDTDQPVSRQHEIELMKHYAWHGYWNGGFYLMPGYGLDTIFPYDTTTETEPAPGVRKADPHLRSTKEVTGYRIHATDGDIGHAVDFVVDDTSWSIRYIVVDMRHWLPGRRVLVSPQWIRSVRWGDRKIFVDLTKDAVCNSPTFDPAKTVSPENAAQLHAHLQKADLAIWVAFTFHAPPGAEIFLAGTFNDWNRTSIRLGDDGTGTYATTVLLPIGRYEYRFLVNGEWQNGPHAVAQTPNGFGGTNNVLVVEPQPRRKESRHTTFPRHAASQEYLLSTAPMTD